jgi:predicted PurR-regulated permease PerM
MQRKVALPPVLTIASVLIMATLLGPIGLVVAVPVLALSLVLLRHIVLGELYGDSSTFDEPTVLRPSGEFGERRARMRAT